MKIKKSYVIRKLNTPKRVTLPDGRTFLAPYERVPRSVLPSNKITRRTYVQRAAPRGRISRTQGGEGIFSVTEKIARNPTVKKITKRGLKYAPGVYQDLTKRVKNKTLKRILNSDAVHLALNKAIKTPD